MKTMIYSVALVFTLFASCAFADCGAKLVVNCQESEQISAAGQTFNSLQTVQVFQEQDGSYRYSASVTPTDNSGALGAPTYSSSGKLTTIGDEFGNAFETSDGSVRFAYIGCGHLYDFEDQNHDMGMMFRPDSCQFN